MKHRRKFIVISVLIGVALLGLLAIQTILINMAYTAKDQAFRQNVSAALQTVAQRLESRELFTTVMWVGQHPDSGSRKDSAKWQAQVSVSTAAEFPDAMPGDTSTPPMRVDGDRLRYVVSAPQKINLRLFDIVSGRETSLVDTFRRQGVYETELDTARFKKGDYMFRYTTSDDSVVLHYAGKIPTGFVKTTGTPGKRELLVSRMMDRLTGFNKESIERRIPPGVLDSLLRTHLRENGVGIDYAYGIQAAGEDSLRVAVPSSATAQLAGTPFRTRLYPADILADRSDLLVYFPDQQWYLWQQVGPYLLATLLFVGFIAFGFARTIRTILRQERLSAQVRDFINNMVHEFKTPLSTITLASEAIVRPDVIGQRPRIRKYTSVIQDETSRMRDQVSKILQMAVVEEGDYELTMKRLDVHDILERACASFSVQVESRGGKLTLATEASSSSISADEMHLTNIVHNILDNALKYTRDAPTIAIRTFTEDGTLVIGIQDNGIGMSADHAQR
ncbi:MAG: two-component sensor histidine kinase, partial [Bacteroidetes bacterium]|nr:two-component sensor histidine kinase [Bacteroidota bacterium]